MPQQPVDLAILGGVVAIIGGIVGMITTARKATKTLARETATELVVTHALECPVGDNLRADAKEREERSDRRLLAIEAELHELNRWLRDRKVQ